MLCLHHTGDRTDYTRLSLITITVKQANHGVGRVGKIVFHSITIKLLGLITGQWISGRVQYDQIRGYEEILS